MATIAESATGTVDKPDVDPVTLDLIENGLRNARYEMDEVLFRTALSPGIREQHDEFPLIGDPTGKMVVGQFGLSVPDFLAGFDGTIEEGDVLLTSDPYACGAAISHANDWLIVLPIFHEGRVVGWASMFGHMSDVGGKTLTPGNAKGTLVDDHRMLQVLAGPRGEFDCLREEGRFDIFARRSTEDFGMPDPKELGEEPWRVAATAR